MNEAPAILPTQNLPARLALAFLNGSEVSFKEGVSWTSETPELFTVEVNPNNGLEATIKPVGIEGMADVVVRTKIANNEGEEFDVEVRGTVTVEVEAGTDLPYTATIEWGEPILATDGQTPAS